MLLIIEVSSEAPFRYVAPFNLVYLLIFHLNTPSVSRVKPRRKKIAQIIIRSWILKDYFDFSEEHTVFMFNFLRLSQASFCFLRLIFVDVDVGTVFLWNFSKLMPDYTMLHPRIQKIINSDQSSIFKDKKTFLTRSSSKHPAL